MLEASKELAEELDELKVQGGKAILRAEGNRQTIQALNQKPGKDITKDRDKPGIDRILLKL